MISTFLNNRNTLPVVLQIFECCSGYCNPVNYVSIGPDLDICQYCNENIDEWSYPVFDIDFYEVNWEYQIAAAA